MTNKKTDLIFVLVFGCLLGLHLWLFCSIRIFPFVDLPDHLASAVIYRDSGQSGNQFEEYFPFVLSPYAGTFPVLFMGSKIFPNVEYAFKIFHCLYLILLPLSIFLVIRKLDGNVWFSLLSFLFMYNYNVCWGMEAFAFFMSLFFFFYYFVIKSFEEDSGSHDTVLALFLLGFYFVHMIGALYALSVFLFALITVGRRSLSWILRKFCLAVPLLVMLGFSAQHPALGGLRTYLIDYYTQGQQINIALRIRELLVFDNFFLAAPVKGDNLALLFSVFIIGYAIYHVWVSAPGSDEANPRIRYATPLVFISFIVFFLFPHRIPGNDSLYQRFSGMVLLSLIVWGSVGAGKMRRHSRALIVLVCLFHLILWADCLIKFDKENHNFKREFFPPATKDKIMTGLIFDRYYGRLPAYIHFPSYYIVWQKGIAVTSLLKWQYYPLCNDLPKKKLPDYDEWAGMHEPIGSDKLDADYLLVRGTIPATYQKYISSHFKEYRKAEKWIIYERLLQP